MFDRPRMTRKFFLEVVLLLLLIVTLSYYGGTWITGTQCPSLVQPATTFLDQYGKTFIESIPQPSGTFQHHVGRSFVKQISNPKNNLTSKFGHIFASTVNAKQLLSKKNKNSSTAHTLTDIRKSQSAKQVRIFPISEKHRMQHGADGTDFLYTGSAVTGENYSSIPFDFYRAVTPEEMLIFQDLLATLDRVTRQNNIIMFMNYGTLLGSLRHHAIVPWDDDCDVAMPYADKNLYATPYSLPSLASSHPNDTTGGGYDVQITADTQFRFTSRSSRQFRSDWPFRWPYIDIDLYFENNTHIWTSNSNVDYIHNRNVVFPLHLRPLGSIWMFAPRDSHQVIVETFADVGLCAIGMEHKVGKERRARRYPCESLKEAYPFVYRGLTPDGREVLETLKLNEKVLYSIVVDEPLVSASVDPFTFKRDQR